MILTTFTGYEHEDPQKFFMDLEPFFLRYHRRRRQDRVPDADAPMRRGNGSTHTIERTDGKANSEEYEAVKKVVVDAYNTPARKFMQRAATNMEIGSYESPNDFWARIQAAA